MAERDAPVQRGTDAQRAHLASRFALCVGSAVVILLCDQLAKALVVHSLGNGRVIDLFGGLLRLDFTRNSGAAFGMFQSGGLIFAAVAIVVSAGILLYARRIASSPAAVRIGLGFILGGALGNLIDRVRLGYVIDFVDLRWWYVFNLADSAIVVGVALLILSTTFESKRSA